MSSEPRQPLIPFTPNAVSNRHDGWTVARQKVFVEALAETGCVQAACRRAGKSDTAAYRLRVRDPVFAEAWDAAVEIGLDRLEDAAVDRALNGVARPVFYKGEQVGEWRHHDERLTMFLLSQRKPERFGRWVQRQPPVEEAYDAGMRLVRAIDGFEDEDSEDDAATDDAATDDA
jgi:hypothetical protein